MGGGGAAGDRDDFQAEEEDGKDQRSVAKEARRAKRSIDRAQSAQSEDYFPKRRRSKNAPPFDYALTQFDATIPCLAKVYPPHEITYPAGRDRQLLRTLQTNAPTRGHRSVFDLDTPPPNNDSGRLCAEGRAIGRDGYHVLSQNAERVEQKLLQSQRGNGVGYIASGKTGGDAGRPALCGLGGSSCCFGQVLDRLLSSPRWHLPGDLLLRGRLTLFFANL